MKHVSMSKLWGMVNRIDSHEKIGIAVKFINECDLDNDQYDGLMSAISYISRELYQMDRRNA